MVKRLWFVNREQHDFVCAGSRWRAIAFGADHVVLIWHQVPPLNGINRLMRTPKAMTSGELKLFFCSGVVVPLTGALPLAMKVAAVKHWSPTSIKEPRLSRRVPD
jgi:hypothetical protein